MILLTAVFNRDIGRTLGGLAANMIVGHYLNELQWSSALT